MQRFSEKKLEERLAGVANSLLEPPSSRDELLRLLDQTEKLLSKVEQSPSKTMQAALSPLMIALVADKLLKHLDNDIKVGIAACISEITRITAPDCPYDDEKMKVVFQLIVSSFENLSDVSSRSYQKRATILETVAKVRSCVMLLDLECDQMIIEMFNYFLKTIRSHHDEVIFSSMETIMTLILDESEDVSPDLLKPILITLKRDNEEVIPISKKLAETVIKSSNPKLRPFLAHAIKSLGSSAEDYCEAVASILCENPSVMEHSNERLSKDEPENDNTESNFQSEEPPVNRSSMPTTSNDKKETKPKVITPAADSSKVVSNHLLDAKSIDESEQVNVDSKKTPDNNGIPSEAVCISPAAGKRSGEGKPPEALQESIVQVSPSRESTNGTKDETSSNQGSIPDESHSEQDSVAVKEVVSDVTTKVSEGDNLSEAKHRHSSGKKQDAKFIEKREQNSVAVKEVVSDLTTKVSEGDNLSDAKHRQSSGKKQDAKFIEKHRELTNEGSPKSNCGTTSNSEASSVDHNMGTTGNNSDGEPSSRKDDEKNDGNDTKDSETGSPRQDLGDASSKLESGSSVQQEVKKRGRGRPRKSAAKEDHGNEKSSLVSKETKDASEETPRTTARRKKTVETEKGSEAIEYNTNLVGSKVKVWWPKDHMFYEGVIASFDSANKKHKVLYNDGDEEILNLRKEKWQLINDALVSNEGAEPSSVDPSSYSRKKKKRDTNSEETPIKRRRKSEGSSKTEEKEVSPVQDIKTEPDSKSNKSKSSKKPSVDAVKASDGSEKKQKQGGKTEGGSAKTPTSKPNDDGSPKTPSLQKRGRPKIGKSEQEGSSKSSASTAKAAEKRKEESGAENVKGKASGEGVETETKSGKKRRR